MERTFSYGPVSIVVVVGDLLQAPVEAVVNAANSQGYLGSGVAGAIAHAGGPKVEDEAVAQAPFPVGKAVITTSGNLKSRGISYVIHAATMPRGGMRIGKENVRLAMGAALECAAENNVKSIAVPALGTGVGGVDKRDAANVMTEALVAHYQGGAILPEIVYFAATGADFYDPLCEALARQLRE